MSQLAARAVVSITSNERKKRTLQLYREWQLAAPSIVGSYQLDVPLSAVRSKIRELFEVNREVQDPKAIDILIHKGKTELEETVLLWKQPSHVMQYFAREESQPKPTDFLNRFYEGRD
ncbi:hypothetical protein BJ684DRAFT_8877 [Piptocephalis cylindrospora]|uniref:Complex 1 LYR protein domain-containing protein n=1 Tax=Piptocephalis cylindrospora TaxID=1907219 RepID=A0A4P9Y5G2_9FUNG|nr:hypothetical protein BJ684DRAFT_8877 [Piptocephalis cylindrospora]|eukprot:RKP14246.1 hypothetical protein BJ684DRAFT_8877 [Piptocephalis cylindrospora]